MSTKTPAELVENLLASLRESRNAITGLGGTIAADAGFKHLPAAITALPSDLSIGTVEDNGIAYRKQVPANSLKYCTIKSIGGMTYKGFTFDATVDTTGEVTASYSFTFPQPFSLPQASGQWAWHPVIFCYPSGTFSDTDIFYNSGASITTMTGRHRLDGVDAPNGTLLRCIPRFEDVETGEFYFPPECFEGLRDTKVTAVRSYKADGALLGAHELPTAITDKLGKGYNAICNEYSFLDKQAVERVGELKVNGSMVTGNYHGGAVVDKSRYAVTLPSDVKRITEYSEPGPLLAPFFDSDGSLTDANGNAAWKYQVISSSGGSTAVAYYFFPLGFFESSGMDAAKAWFDKAQLPLVYEKATHVTTAINTDFNPTIEVEPGGYIEFVNQYGQAVPSTVTFNTLMT